MMVVIGTKSVKNPLSGELKPSPLLKIILTSTKIASTANIPRIVGKIVLIILGFIIANYYIKI